MKINQFYGCTSADEVQLRFDALSKVFSNQDEMLKSLRIEYSTLLSVLPASQTKENVEENVEEKPSLSDIINLLQERINPEGLKLEIVGKWLWLSGTTFAVREGLKQLDFRYSPDKKSWYWRSDENRSSNEKPIPLEMIRAKYGSSVVGL